MPETQQTYDSSNSSDLITFEKEPLNQDILKMENKTLKYELGSLRKILNEMENTMTEQKFEMRYRALDLQKLLEKENSGGGQVNSATSRVWNVLKCELCNVTCTGYDNYAQHRSGAKHQKNVKQRFVPSIGNIEKAM